MTFPEFLSRFFALFAGNSFNGREYLTYLDAPLTGDEAAIVDNAVTAPILGLLGFAPGEQVYNLAKNGDRPDFAPELPGSGTCFYVEDKNTSLALDLDLSKRDSHLSQLRRYANTNGVANGWLTNGRLLHIYRFPDSRDAAPLLLAKLDLQAALATYAANANFDKLDADDRDALRLLYDQYRRDAFTEPLLWEQELALDEAAWLAQAKPLGGVENSVNESLLVESLQRVVKELAADAYRTLREHVTRQTEYENHIQWLDDTQTVRPEERFAALRESIVNRLRTLASVVGMTSCEVTDCETLLARLEKDPRTVSAPDALKEAIFAAVQAAAERKMKRKLAATSSELQALGNAVDTFAETAFLHHQRQARLRQTFRANLQVADDFRVWESLVRETMLGDQTETEKQEEFALQAAYVIFIRLLLIRVCEDKGIFPHRFLTDGGIIEWQKDIERYLQFANGNPYLPLLEMAYKNAQNIYAHFFTGRELFNWYALDRPRLIQTLYQLSRFNFADVDADIVGTVYNNYVGRKEKKKKGQYYTPTEIVRYILDTTGYRPESGIVGKRLIDPACGSGKFLVEASRRLVAAYAGADDPARVLGEVRNALFGFDLNPFACYLAEVNLLIQVLPLVRDTIARTGKPPRLERFHIYNVDALAVPSRTYFYAQVGSLMAEERDEVEQIKGRTPGTVYAGGFHFVVANPPYGAKLTDAYKATLREDYADVWRGQPDTYVFFYELALRLLAPSGRIGFITPNTFLMGTNTDKLRRRLLEAGRLTEIVDLPQGIWADANVDCVLLFLHADTNPTRRAENPIQVQLLGLKDTLDKLTARTFGETLTHRQGDWLPATPEAAPAHGYEMPIRFDALLAQTEKACEIPASGGGVKVLRLGDVTDSTAGIDPYRTEAEGRGNLHIKSRVTLPQDRTTWKKLLDSNSFVGRYEVRWGEPQNYINYGDWLERAREPRFFDSPKLLVQDMRNRALKRRLVATYDEAGFYNRKNFNNIVSNDGKFDLKYLLALFNSSLLNLFFARRLDNLHVNPSYFRDLPVYPATPEQQAPLVALVDRILARNAELNALRELGYTIKHTRKGESVITVPYDHLVAELQRADPSYPVLTLFQARFAGVWTLPEACAARRTDTAISARVYTPVRFPQTLVLKHNLLWLDVPADDFRRYLSRLLSQPRYTGRTLESLEQDALVPADPDALAQLFAAEAHEIARIQVIQAEIAAIDNEIDNRILDLYRITDPADRQRILGAAPPTEDEPTDDVASEAPIAA